MRQFINTLKTISAAQFVRCFGSIYWLLCWLKLKLPAIYRHAATPWINPAPGWHPGTQVPSTIVTAAIYRQWAAWKLSRELLRDIRIRTWSKYRFSFSCLLHATCCMLQHAQVLHKYISFHLFSSYILLLTLRKFAKLNLFIH